MSIADKFKKNITINYVYNFSQLNVTSAIWGLYLVFKGGNDNDRVSF
ncbi:MAG: hypothetical protein K0R50_50 [Eubacterium sp.]|jgi:hypothetical protein|nr:hypothetical protein [Eubacterium sp.]